MSASTSKGKKVRYESGTKGSSSSSHHHRSSRDERDSGIGSSNASVRASLGTGIAHNSSSLNASEIAAQRHNLRAVQEALDSAHERIRECEVEKANLSAMLSESNKENRLLKKEKSDLCNRVEELLDDLEDEKKRVERLRRGSSERKSPPRSSPRNSRELEAAAISSYQRGSSRRSPIYQSQQQQAQMYPAVPPAPANSAPNSFLPSPRHSSSGVPSVIFSPERVPLSSSSYAVPSVSSYSSAPSSGYTHAPAPLQSRSRHGSSGASAGDGRYHLSPL
ncbi:hypothetical protein WAI453_009872 [Rhynchosporium graminicola]|uniref:Uncharacterized protein n=1 Tax=Rhynchosporium graminicola TaxID=2792576 RepID=A0A1E1KEA1_9HELO|nr:uncharacterized protein RCO7_04952 [Rhynchosporium commune]